MSATSGKPSRRPSSYERDRRTGQANGLLTLHKRELRPLWDSTPKHGPAVPTHRCKRHAPLDSGRVSRPRAEWTLPIDRRPDAQPPRPISVRGRTERVIRDRRGLTSSSRCGRSSGTCPTRAGGRFCRRPSRCEDRSQPAATSAMRESVPQTGRVHSHRHILGEGGVLVVGPVVEGGEQAVVVAGAGGVALVAAGTNLGCPQWPVRCGDHLDVAAVVMVFA